MKATIQKLQKFADSDTRKASHFPKNMPHKESSSSFVEACEKLSPSINDFFNKTGYNFR